MRKQIFLWNLTASLLLCSLITKAQEREGLMPLKPFIGKTWAVEGTWGDGSIFKQEITMEWGLDGTIIKTHTRGFTNVDRTEVGDRNFGVRRYNKDTDTIEFYEFDIFGGYTPGYVKVEGKDLYYIYAYGDAVIADIWGYVDEETYTFKVVSYDDGEVGDLYLSTEYRLKK